MLSQLHVYPGILPEGHKKPLRTPPMTVFPRLPPLLGVCGWVLIGEELLVVVYVEEDRSHQPCAPDRGENGVPEWGVGVVKDGEEDEDEESISESF